MRPMGTQGEGSGPALTQVAVGVQTDVLLQLLRDHSIERDDENVLAGDIEPFRMKNPLYSPHQTERLAGARASLDADRTRIGLVKAAVRPICPSSIR